MTNWKQRGVLFILPMVSKWIHLRESTEKVRSSLYKMKLWISCITMQSHETELIYIIILQADALTSVVVKRWTMVSRLSPAVYGHHAAIHLLTMWKHILTPPASKKKRKKKEDLSGVSKLKIVLVELAFVGNHSTMLSILLLTDSVLTEYSCFCFIVGSFIYTWKSDTLITQKWVKQNWRWNVSDNRREDEAKEGETEEKTTTEDNNSNDNKKKVS